MFYKENVFLCAYSHIARQKNEKAISKNSVAFDILAEADIYGSEYIILSAIGDDPLDHLAVLRGKIPRVDVIRHYVIRRNGRRGRFYRKEV